MFSSVVLLAGIAALANAEYLTATPATVYESETISPQNADYDKVNKKFPAHSGWYNDQLIHYYKFRMYTPGTYPTKIVPGQPPQVPIGKVFMITTDGTKDTVIADQKPILEFHTIDGESYSDFVELVFVTAPAGYVANTYKALDDLVKNNVVKTPTGKYINMPVVPTGSKLAMPGNEAMAAPIEPVIAFYKGVEVQTFVFEVSDESLKTKFASTRTVAGADWEITVVPDLVSGGKVSAIPLWHLNQHWDGVTTGTNSGGPNPMGQRNVINLDRADTGYSPLWAIEWVTKLPVNYRPDDASSNAAMTTANGFAVSATPMLVNCPDVGAVGPVNSAKKTTFGGAVATDAEVILQGALIMMGGIELKAVTPNAVEIGSTTTNGMGGYVFKFTASVLGEERMVKIMKGDDLLETFVIKVEGDEAAAGPTTTAAPVDGSTTAAAPVNGTTAPVNGTTVAEGSATTDDSAAASLTVAVVAAFAALALLF